MEKQQYKAPETEIIVIRQEAAFLTASDPTGRADRGYEDNEMEEL